MIIIAGHLLVEPAARDQFVQTMQELVGRARTTPGCIEIAITADPLDPGRVQNVEIWSDSDALERWRAQADAPDTGVAVIEDHVARYDATDGGPLFA